ncbi:MAG TPA: hypothetical protein VGM86_10530 [Thermoanaerobaculia bacterium]
MILSRGQLITVALVALAILLPGAADAQGNCCSCSFDGTNCSACCYVDQTPSCVVDSSGSILFCSCTCEPKGGGGGGGGGGGAGGCALRLSSHTIVMGADRGADRGAKLAGYQLGFGLLHPGKRREGSFNFEEWALVSSEGAVLRASTGEFADRVQNEAERFRPRGKGSSPSTVLVIEDADHPHNSREIPVPAVAPIDFDAGLPMSVAGQEMWFRAEIGEDGVIDQMILLNIPDDLVSGKDLVEGSLNDRLRERLSLRYADARRHRVVVFGLVRANTKGHLVMTRSHVILPKCCCNGYHCV